MPEHALKEIVSCIATLAEYKATDALATILDAGASGCIEGFVPGYKVWSLQPEQRYSSILNRVLKILKISQKRKEIVASTSNIPPQNASSHGAIPFDQYQDDNKKKIQLNICRVLLPNLASSSTLEPLLNMSEKYEYGSASPAKQSLRHSINAMLPGTVGARYTLTGYFVSQHLLSREGTTMKAEVLKRSGLA